VLGSYPDNLEYSLFLYTVLYKEVKSNKKKQKAEERIKNVK